MSKERKQTRRDFLTKAGLTVAGLVVGSSAAASVVGSSKERLQTEEKPPRIKPGEIPTLEQIEEYCDRYFTPVTEPPFGHWGVIKDSDPEDMRVSIDEIEGGEVIGRSEVDVSNIAQIQHCQIWDEKGFSEGSLDAFEIVNEDVEQNQERVQDVVDVIQEGAHVWIADVPLGRIWRLHCEAGWKLHIPMVRNP